MLRLEEALRAAAVAPEPIFAAAGLQHYVQERPERMVPEGDVTALYAALFQTLPFAAAHRLADDAGVRTARYLLTHRIPKPAQLVLRALPPTLASRALLALIERHSWTFAGSAELSIRHGRPVILHFAGSPLSRDLKAMPAPVCAFYCGTFRHLFQTLVAASAQVEEQQCSACGAPHCQVEITW